MCFPVKAHLLARVARAALFLALVAAAACSSSPAAPTAGTYEIDFPTVAAAIDSKTVTVYAFDPAVSCDGLLADVASGSFPAIASQTSGSVCGLGAGDGGSLALPFGSYTVVVVISDATGTIILDGCTTETISASSPSAVVTVQVASDAISIPPVAPSCTLAAHCGGEAGC